ncbi:hypothetical protein SCUCBS95973_002721 [Sporothrix curviconia]|uniref:C6 zinc finger domain containing protein n=1 Tax=Sporothrix curviconia TaxID=1260050 RepID=A0ABP0B9A2_9PEZI
MAMSVAMGGAGSHEYVLAAVWSLSAAYNVGGGGDIRRMHSAFSYYDRAVRLLQPVTPASWQDNQAYLTTIFLLAWFDIVVFDPDKWTVHLRMACGLVNSQDDVDAMWATASGRRIVHAVARLDCSNALCNRAPPMLCQRAYNLLAHEPRRNIDDSSLDQQVDAECMRLHGILGRAAHLSYHWTLGGGELDSDVDVQTRSVLSQLQDWHDRLPAALQWPRTDDGEHIDDLAILAAWLADKPPLFKKLWLHYLAITVHLYHMLDPVASGLWNASVQLARRCLLLVQVCHDADDGRPHSLYNGDMSILFVLAVVGVLIDDPGDRSWIQAYLLQHRRETLWCGYERAACLRAWWRSLDAGKRLILSQPDRQDTPLLVGSGRDGDDDNNCEYGVGNTVKVRILYEDLVTRQVQADYHEFAYCELAAG